MEDLNTLELDNYEHDLISSLVRAFAWSVDKDVKHDGADKVSYPIMLKTAISILDKMGLDYQREESAS